MWTVKSVLLQKSNIHLLHVCFNARIHNHTNTLTHTIVIYMVYIRIMIYLQFIFYSHTQLAYIYQTQTYIDRQDIHTRTHTHILELIRELSINRVNLNLSRTEDHTHITTTQTPFTQPNHEHTLDAHTSRPQLRQHQPI